MSPAPVSRRKSRDQRRPNEAYPTQLIVACRALSFLPKPPPRSVVVDPGAGTGTWGRAFRERWPKVHLIGIDLPGVPRAEGYDDWIAADFLVWAKTQPEIADRVIGNPPYGEWAEPFIWHGLHLLKPGGIMAYLLPLEFLGGVARRLNLYVPVPPYAVYVSSRRLDFIGGGGDMRNHAVYVWQKGRKEPPLVDWFDYEDGGYEQQPLMERT